VNNDTQTLIEQVRGFLDRHVIPAEAGLDAGNGATLNRLRRLAKSEGLWALPLPEDLGGGGLALLDYFGLAEHEGRSDHGPDVMGSGSLLNVRTLQAHAGAEIRAAVLPGPVAGDLHVSYAMTEPGVAGSDPSGLRATARRAGDGSWTVSGRKWFTTSADRADIVLVLARTENDAPTRSAFSLFAVPTDAAGFRVVGELDVLGAGGQHELGFDEVRVPHTHLIGAPGAGMDIAAERLALGRTLRALRWVGQAQRAVELLCHRAAGRRLGDGHLADQQLVQQHVFEAEFATRSARELVTRAADSVINETRGHIEVGMAKVAAARAVSTAVDAAIQVYGAEGLTAATGLPGLMRTARTARILDGADELHISSAARRLIRGYVAESDVGGFD
jgi:alkylation response protein AidB-like acyl-CoA dehydrogenase